MFDKAKTNLRDRLWRFNNRLSGASYSRLERRIGDLEKKIDGLRKENRKAFALLSRIHDREQAERLDLASRNHAPLDNRDMKP
jgi:ABC-type phosphate transport system auxiliary subunit